MYNILIVDDEPLVRRGIKTFVDFDALKIQHIFEAENGEQGLEIFKREEIHIVLADINMPRMNGLDFAKAIKAISPRCKIALITGYDYFDYARNAVKIGVDDYILKPVSKKDITEIIIQLINKYNETLKYDRLEKVIHQMKGDQGLSDEQGYEQQITWYIESHLGNHALSLSELAQQIGLSQGYLSGLFKKLYGLSFQEYVVKSRIEKAKVLILTTDMKNYEIAEAVGFEDPNYFATKFKKEVGVSPKQYKNHSVI